MLFETRHEGRHHTWWLLHAGDGDEAAVFNALRDAVGEATHVDNVFADGETSTVD